MNRDPVERLPYWATTLLAISVWVLGIMLATGCWMLAKGIGGVL